MEAFSIGSRIGHVHGEVEVDVDSFKGVNFGVVKAQDLGQPDSRQRVFLKAPATPAYLERLLGEIQNAVQDVTGIPGVHVAES